MGKSVNSLLDLNKVVNTSINNKILKRVKCVDEDACVFKDENNKTCYLHKIQTNGFERKYKDDKFYIVISVYETDNYMFVIEAISSTVSMERLLENVPKYSNYFYGLTTNVVVNYIINSFYVNFKELKDEDLLDNVKELRSTIKDNDVINIILKLNVLYNMFLQVTGKQPIKNLRLKDEKQVDETSVITTRLETLEKAVEEVKSLGMDTTVLDNEINNLKHSISVKKLSVIINREIDDVEFMVLTKDNKILKVIKDKAVNGNEILLYDIINGETVEIKDCVAIYSIEMKFEI